MFTIPFEELYDALKFPHSDHKERGCHKCVYLHFPSEADPCCECSPSNQLVGYKEVTEGAEERERLKALVTAFKGEIANRRDAEQELDNILEEIHILKGNCDDR